MKIIRCSLWGDIQVSALAISIIDTPTFQRLHDIRQNGFAYKVFPTATVSRFSHSLGVYHLTKKLINHLLCIQPELNTPFFDKCRELIAIAGLCHDLGHGPFSHWFDQFIEHSHVTTSPFAVHENRSTMLFRHLVVKGNIDISPEEIDFVCNLIQNNNKNSEWFSSIIHNPYSAIDTDKMDYLLRDVYSFGLKFMYDPLRIIKNARVIDNQLCFCNRVHDEILTMFTIRQKMFREIYLHPTIQKFDQCFDKVVQDCPLLINDIYATILNHDCEAFIRMTDAWILYQVSDSPLFSAMMCRQWAVFEPFVFKTYHDSQFPLIRQIPFFQRKNPTTTFLLEF
jgi:HD superfamily phosphohydrolase